MFVKWRWSIDLISVRAAVGDADEVRATAWRVVAVDRCERVLLVERRLVACVGVACTVLTIVVTVRVGAVVVAAARAALAGVSEPATTMITATPAPSSSTAIRPARAMIRPRW